MVCSRTMQHTVKRQTHYLGETKLSVLEAGQDQLGTVMLLHGIPAGAELWRGIAERLAAAGYRVLAPDLPGYGHSRLPAEADYSLEGAASLLAEWLREDVRTPVHLVAHDIGGGVAQRLLTAHPDLFPSAVFCNAIIGDTWPVRPIILMQLMARFGLLVPLAAMRLMPNPYATWELRHSVVQQTQLNPDVQKRIFWDGKFRDAEGRRQFARHLLALTPEQTLAWESELANYDKPVQLVWGMRDRFQSWDVVGERYRKVWPKAQIAKLESAGHFLQLDCPVEFTQALLDFWAA